MGRMHLPVLVAALAAGLSAAQQLDLTNVAVDPDGWEFVDVSRPPLDTIRGGEFGTALAIDDTSSFPLVSAPIPVEGSGVDSGSVHGFVTLDENWIYDSTMTVPEVDSTDQFGAAMATGGSVALVGAPRADFPGLDQGAVYVFDFVVLPERDPQWTYNTRVTAADGEDFDNFGAALSTDGVLAAIGVPQGNVAGRGSAGKVYIYTVGSWSSPAAVLWAPDLEISAGFGNAVALQADIIAIGAANKNGVEEPFPTDVGATYVFQTHDNGTSWNLLVKLDPPDDRPSLRRFGSSVAVGFADDLVRVLSGAPGGTGLAAGQVAEAGAAYIHTYNRTADVWELEVRLEDPVGAASGDLFGAQVALRDTRACVSAPRRGVNELGAAYLFRVTNGSTWFARVRLTAADGSLEDRFGTSVFLGDDRVIVGSSRHSSFQGAVYQYDGPEFFPIGLPTFHPPSGTVFLEDGLPLRVTVVAQKPFQETVHYEVGSGNFPVTRESPTVVNDTIFLPVVDTYGVYDVSAMSASRRFISFPVFWRYDVYAPTPGFFWVPDEEVLKACGSPEFYCPGIGGDWTRHRVTPGYYTLPVDTPDQRTHQRACEVDAFCIEGIRFACPDVVCWPLPVRAEAKEGGPFEEGIGLGDTITITFNKRANFANVTGAHRIRDLMTFTTPIGNLTGHWFNQTVLILTVVDTMGAGDPERTRADVLGFVMHEAGGIKMEQNRTLATRFEEPFIVRGEWGRVDPPPAIASAVAASGGDATQGGFGPGDTDTLTLTLDKIARTIPFASQAEVDQVLEFKPPVTDVNYTGEWLAWDTMRVTFANLTDRPPEPWPSTTDLRSDILHRVPDLWEYGGRVWPTEPIYREQWRVGKLQVSFRVGSGMISRDRSSDEPPPANVVVQGSWGDMPGRVNANFESPTAFWVNWLPTASTFGYDTPRYLLQVRAGQPFDDTSPYTPTADGSPLFVNATVQRDEGAEAGLRDYRQLVAGATTYERYFIRVFAWNRDGQWGPPRLSDPEAMVPAPVEVVNVRGGRNLPLFGGLVLLEITSVGTGQHVRRLPVRAFMVNGSAGVDVEFEASNCEIDLDGFTAVCDAPEGVGHSYSWRVDVNGVTGTPSPRNTSTMSTFFPPVVTGFVSDVPDLFKVQATATVTASPSSTNTPTPTPTSSKPAGLTPSPSQSATPSATASATPSSSLSTTSTRSVTPTSSPSTELTLSSTPSTSTTPSAVPSPTVERSPGYFTSLFVSGSGALSDPHLTTGMEPIRIFGMNFGRASVVNDLVEATYWPRALPDSKLRATNCTVVTDHVEVVCYTAPGVGADLQWSVAIAGQESVVTVTNYSDPIISSVFHRHNDTMAQLVPEPLDALQQPLATQGGTEIVVRGLAFGEVREDVVPVLALVSEDLIGAVPDETSYNYLRPDDAEMAALFNDKWPRTHPKFVTRDCRITVAQQELRCAAPEGFGGPLQAAVSVVGATSNPFRVPGLSYALPVLKRLQIVRVNYTSSGNSSTSTSDIVTSVLDFDANNEDFVVPQPRTSGSDREWAVHGENLAGAHPENVRVRFRGEPLPVTPVSHSELRVVIPPGTGAGHSLFVSVAGRNTPQVLTLNYQPPIIDAFSLKEMRTVTLPEEGVRSIPCIRISGLNFGGDLVDPAVTGSIAATVEGVPCRSIEDITHTSFTCCSTAVQGIVFITVHNQTGQPDVLVVQDLDDAPVLESMHPTSGASNDLTIITLEGTGFVDPIPSQVTLRGYDMVYGDPDGNVGVDEILCNVIVLENELITCELPWASGPDIEVRITRPSLLGLGVLDSLQTFTYRIDAPRVVYVHPTRIPDEGGILTIIGHSFGTRGNVFFRGLTPEQILQAEVSLLDGADVNETLVLAEPVDAISLNNGTGVAFDALPRCAPVLVWTHNRIECWVHPARVPRGAMELNVGWTADVRFPGLLFESDLAGAQPSLTDDQVFNAWQNPDPVDNVGAIYYPRLTQVIDQRLKPNAAVGVRPAWVLTLVWVGCAVLAAVM